MDGAVFGNGGALLQSLSDAAGHLFQGRYQALLVENASALVRLVHYINLNPVRAGIVEAASVAKFRWGSLRRFVCGGRPSWLQAEVVLAAFNLEATPRDGEGTWNS